MKRTVSAFLALCLVLGLTACTGDPAPQSPSTQPDSPPPASSPAAEPFSPSPAPDPVVYTQSARGRNGDIVVDITLTGSEITAVTIREQSETVGVADAALEQMPARIVEHQSLAVDMVAGATQTSAAIRMAVSSAISEAGLNPSDYNTRPTHQAQALPDQTADIVIVGGGTAGLAAAIGAASEGASVIVLEKNAMTGGSGALSSARMNIIDSVFVKENAPDADDSWDTLRTYLEGKYAEGSDTYPVNWDYLYYNLTTLDETVRLLVSHGVDFEAKVSSHGAEVIGKGGGAAFMTSMAQAAEKLGVTILTDTTGDSILMENGAAVGVQATSRGDTLTVHASKVILATGGSLYDTGAKFENYPADSKAILYRGSSSGDTGDGQRMAAQVGAAIEGGLRIKQSGVEFDQLLRSSVPSSDRPNTAACLVVNAQGERFMNEATGGQAMADILWKEGSAHYWLIADTKAENVASALKTAYENGLSLHYGTTLADLATSIGVDAAALQSTMDRYNTLCAASADTDFGKQAERMVAYEGTTGYYAYDIYGGSYGTMGGGIKTDYNCHVLTAANAVIPNLFAAGECADGSIYGDYYVGGMSMGTFTTIGRVAGTTAAGELK